MGKFADQFAKSIDKAYEKVCKTAEGGTILLFSAIVLDSPVDTGQLRANWIPSLDEPWTEAIYGDTSKDGATSTQNIQNVVTVGHVNYLTNALPYAPVIEYGLYPNPPKKPTGRTVNGFSTQAPQGMVTINTLRFNRYLKTAAEVV